MIEFLENGILKALIHDSYYFFCKVVDIDLDADSIVTFGKLLPFLL
jgi:hypothetical protein